MADDMAALHLRLDELAATVQEERGLRQRAEADLAAARAGMVAPAVVPVIPDQQQVPAAAVPKGPKIGVPDKYDGTRGAKAEAYVTQIGLYVLLNPGMFPDDRTKVIFSILYLTGQASTWAQPYTTKLFAGQQVSYVEFSTAFQMMYYNTEKKSRAEKALRQLKQKKTVAHYTFQFNQYATNTGWEMTTLMSHYQQGLKKDIRLALVLARAHFAVLSDLCNLALKINNEVNGADLSVADSTPVADPNAMDLSAMRGVLSDKEKIEMMRAGQCFFCGEKGHLARDCPKKTKKKGKAAVRIAELEEQVRQLKAGPEASGSGG